MRELLVEAMRSKLHVFVVFMIVGCGDGTSTTGSDLCTPGQHLPCLCENGDSSVKVCNSAGQAFGICDCAIKSLHCVVDDDCLESGLVVSECQQVVCNLLESRCQVATIPVGGECDDTNSCTINDKCTVDGCLGQVMDCTRGPRDLV